MKERVAYINAKEVEAAQCTLQVNPKSKCRKVESDTAGWKQKHAKLRVELGFESTQKSTRTEDVIALADEFLTKKHPGTPKEMLWTDTSQCASRRPWALTLRSVTTSSTIYCHGKGRWVLPVELYRAMGFPCDLNLAGLSAAAQKDLLGEAMCANKEKKHKTIEGADISSCLQQSAMSRSANISTCLSSACSNRVFLC
eukprot:6492652-Amphidinium_carterae.6